MLAVVAQIIVLLLGASICVFSVWGLSAPDKLMKQVVGVAGQPWGIHVAVVVRLALGLALIAIAPDSRFPLVFQALGWLTIAAAVALSVMGRQGIRKVVAWFEDFSPATIRIWLLVGMAFGGFLVFGVA